jgi:hypothetical protein
MSDQRSIHVGAATGCGGRFRSGLVAWSLTNRWRTLSNLEQTLPPLNAILSWLSVFLPAMRPFRSKVSDPAAGEPNPVPVKAKLSSMK